MSADEQKFKLEVMVEAIQEATKKCQASVRNCILRVLCPCSYQGAIDDVYYRKDYEFDKASSTLHMQEFTLKHVRPQNVDNDPMCPDGLYAGS